MLARHALSSSFLPSENEKSNEQIVSGARKKILFAKVQARIDCFGSIRVVAHSLASLNSARQAFLSAPADFCTHRRDGLAIRLSG